MSSNGSRPGPDPAAFRRAVRGWARGLDRPLPWRGERDPYRVLVSEVMLQQTQAARVAPSYEAFLRRFPDVAKLAAAGADEAMRAWEGLGYNRRARNLWRSAREIVGRGRFPGDVPGLASLPGVGPYTARAVASFAFGVPVAAVDANVRRVLTRCHGLPPDEDVQELADALVPRAAPGEWNQAMIDLGAVLCRARSPRCAACPLSGMCAWSAGRRPPRRRAAPTEAMPFTATRRFVRGRVVAQLRRGAVREEALPGRLGLPAARVSEAVDSLVREGLVSRRRGRLRLAG